MSKLPDDPKVLKAIIMRLEGERDDLHTTNLRLQVELDRLKKRYYGPRADRLETMTDLAQMLLSWLLWLLQGRTSSSIFRVY